MKSEVGGEFRGVPSWNVLRAALQSMGEHETADRISN